MIDDDYSPRLQVRLNIEEYGDILGYLDQVSGSTRSGRIRRLLRLGYAVACKQSLAETVSGKSVPAGNAIDLSTPLVTRQDNPGDFY